MKPQDFVNKYLGQTKGYPDDSQYLGECLSIVKLFIKEVYGISPPPSGTNSAYGYWSNFPNPLGVVFTKIKNDPGVVPQPFDIIIWSPTASNSYGHIAIVKSASKESAKFISYDQNWNSRVFQETSHLYTNVIGWLRAKEVTTSDNIDQLKKDLEEQQQQVRNYVKQVTGLSADLKEKDGFITEITGQLKTANDTSKGYLNEIKTAKETLSTTFDCKPEWVEINAKATEAVGFIDKADELDRKLSIEVKEHQADVESFGKEIAGLKTQLAVLETKYKELKNTTVTPTQPTQKYSILELLKKLFGG